MPDLPGNKLFRDLTGEEFGRLVVLGYAGAMVTPSGQRRHRWFCRCVCGNETEVGGGNLKSGTVVSCGCLRLEQVTRAKLIDLTGKKFGRLHVLGKSHAKGQQIYWSCRCDCGVESTVAGNSLNHGKSRSCGCRQGNFAHGMWGKPGYKKFYLSDPARKIRHAIGSAVRSALKAAGGSKNGASVFDKLPYTPEQLKLHLESLFEPWMAWDNYGGRNDNPSKTWHIDHIRPQASFSFTSLDDTAFLECWALDNLRPMEKIENIKRQRSRRTGL